MQRIGQMQVIENSSEGTSKGQDEVVVILFHGYGADAYDLKSLSEVLETAAPTRWIFPQGVIEVPIGPGWTGRAWWPIDIAALQQAQASGTPRDLSKETHPGVPELRQKVMKMIADIKTPWNKIIVGGFSQGAMLATDIYLHAPEAPLGLVILSGNLVNKANLKELVGARAGKRFFMSHGEQDAVLSIRGAQQLESFLTSGGMKGRLFQFRGGHEIPMPVIVEANKYLKEITSEK